MKLIENGLVLNVQNHFNKIKAFVVTKHPIMELPNLLAKNNLKNSIEEAI